MRVLSNYFGLQHLDAIGKILQECKNLFGYFEDAVYCLYRNVALGKTIRFLPNLWKALKAQSLNFPKYTRGSAFKS